MAALVVATLSAAGCNPSYLREGAGLELYQASTVEQTDLEDVYIGHLCRRAGLAPLGAVQCDPTVSGSVAWTAVTEAGINDIDRRCDAYLAWIDTQKKNSAPILQQITDVRNATAAILQFSGVSGVAVAVVAQAFGLASNTFANVNARLVTEIDHSTLQSIVLRSQRRFQSEIAGQSVPNRPAAIRILRSYLRICMPFTIETEINSTLSTIARTGLLPEPQSSLRNAGELAPANGPMTAGSRVPRGNGRGRSLPDPILAQFFDRYDPGRLPKSAGDAFLQALCASPGEIASGSRRLGELVDIFENGGPYDPISATVPVAFSPKRSGTLDAKEQRFLGSNLPSTNCGAALNYYEKFYFGSGMAPNQATRLRRFLGLASDTSSGSIALSDMRPLVERARACLGTKVPRTSNSGEITKDLWEAIAAPHAGGCGQ